MSGDFRGLMIVPAPPPALTCKLPGPWHDSQPMFLCVFPFRLQSRVSGCSEIAHDLFVAGRAFL